jgi:hypothetical protein
MRKLKRILKMPRIILEIGCGDARAALQIAAGNPDIGVVATDLYDWDCQLGECSHYRKVAMQWRQRQLCVQQAMPENLVLLRAGADVIGCFPDGLLDSILLINPEPRVAEAFLASMVASSWIDKLKPGDSQILVLPYSRALGVMAHGGFEFDHSEDCSKGIGFLVSGPLKFRRGENLQWGLDLRRASAYSKNSTLDNVYVYGNRYQEKPESFWSRWLRRIF